MVWASMQQMQVKPDPGVNQISWLLLPVLFTVSEILSSSSLRGVGCEFSRACIVIVLRQKGW
jgi:hypothetical protein